MHVGHDVVAQPFFEFCRAPQIDVCQVRLELSDLTGQDRWVDLLT